MTQKIEHPHELVSALVDGELHARDFGRAVELMDASAEARAFWHASHLVGDVMRSRELAGHATGDAEFVARLRDRLDAEQAVRRQQLASVTDPKAAHRAPAANNTRMRWVAGVAGLAFVAGMVWHQWPDRNGAITAGSQLARQSISPTSGSDGQDAAAMVRDPRLDQLLAAHQQQGGASALYRPTGFLRGATYERPAR